MCLGELKLYGMRSAYDEVMATGIKRQHEPPRIVGDLLSAEIAEKQARSIKYQLAAYQSQQVVMVWVRAPVTDHIASSPSLATNTCDTKTPDSPGAADLSRVLGIERHCISEPTLSTRWLRKPKTSIIASMGSHRSFRWFYRFLPFPFCAASWEFSTEAIRLKE